MYSKKKLTSMALSRFIPGILIISALLFIPAGSVKFWNAWLFMGVLFIPMFMFMPLVLGSFYALVPLLIFPFQMSIRMKNEEEILEKGLDGYTQYKERVKYKIIPLFW